VPNVRYGMELFGKGRIHWHFDTDSLDKITAINGKMVQETGREFKPPFGTRNRSYGNWLPCSGRT
jgi:hypothetical protein